MDDVGGLGRVLIIIGLAVAVVGVLLTVGLPIGRLPGDVTVRGDGWTVYVPIATSILLSVALTLAFAAVSAMSRR